jgi:Uma2 family endonuclease
VQRGAEPDECYIFGNAQDRVAPDLAIEVVWTSGGINKLDVYRKLGVNEVWYWSRGRIDVYLLRDEQYELAPVSQALRGIDLRQLERFVDQPTTSAAMLAYRAALRG